MYEFDNQAQITVAELDATVTEFARDQMAVDTQSMTIIHNDARTVLYRQQQRQFDVIVTDAFHDIAIPYHLVTREFVQLARSRMKKDGLFTTNIVDAWPDPLMVKSMMKTLQQEFDHVSVWLETVPFRPQRMTFVIAAADKPVNVDKLGSRRGIVRSWYRVNQHLTEKGTPLSELPVFTDNYVPVERMISDLLLTSEGR